MKLPNIFKKAANEAAPPSVGQQAGQQVGQQAGQQVGQQAREHHYNFAHQALPQTAFARPAQVMGILGDSDAVAFLESVWQSVGENLPRGQRISSQGLRCATRRVDNYAVAIVVLPPAVNVLETIFVALAYGPMIDNSEEEWQKLPLRYFTLEVGFFLDGDEPGRTVLGEWTNPPAHLNWGDGPPADDPDAFLEAVRALLNQSGELRGSTNPAA